MIEAHVQAVAVPRCFSCVCQYCLLSHESRLACLLPVMCPIEATR